MSPSAAPALCRARRPSWTEAPSPPAEAGSLRCAGHKRQRQLNGFTRPFGLEGCRRHASLGPSALCMCSNLRHEQTAQHATRNKAASQIVSCLPRIHKPRVWLINRGSPFQEETRHCHVANFAHLAFSRPTSTRTSVLVTWDTTPRAAQCGSLPRGRFSFWGNTPRSYEEGIGKSRLSIKMT